MRFFCPLLRENGCSVAHSDGRNGPCVFFYTLGRRRPPRIHFFLPIQAMPQKHPADHPAMSPTPPPHTKQSSSWVVRRQETPRTLSMRHRDVPRQKQHVWTASARRTRRVRGAPTVAVASPNRRIWGFWRGGGGRAMLSPAGRCPLSGLSSFFSYEGHPQRVFFTLG